MLNPPSKSSLRFQVVVFTIIRTVINTMNRMVYPFLAVFSRGLGVELQAMALAVTFRSLSGIVAPFLAPVADRRGRKLAMLLGVGLFASGTGIVILWPTYPVFALALALTMIGNHVFAPAMQAYLGDRVAYENRGRVLAITEYGWSLSLMIGIPIAGFLIARLGWISPVVLLAVLGSLSFLVLLWMLPRDPQPDASAPHLWASLRRILTYKPALIALVAGVCMSTANETINLVFGVWMEDAFSLKIAALGVAAAVIGLSELGGETLSVWLTDMLGKTSAVSLGVAANCVAALALPFLGSSVPGALLGLIIFYISFEFSIVSSIPLMTEIVPSARATLLAVNAAMLYLGRAVGAQIAVQFYTLGKSLPTLPDLMLNGLAVIGFNLCALVLLHFLRRYIR